MTGSIGNRQDRLKNPSFIRLSSVQTIKFICKISCIQHSFWIYETSYTASKKSFTLASVWCKTAQNTGGVGGAGVYPQT